MIVTRLKRMLAAASVILAGMLPQANAATFYEGYRAGTNQQIEQQVENTHQIELKGKTTLDDVTKENLSGKLTLKGWHGQTDKNPNGYWWFVGVPYNKVTTNNNETNMGIGDVTVGAGPIGRLGSISWGSYIAVSFPTGDTGYQRPDKDYSLEGFVKDITATTDRPGRIKLLLDYANRVAKYESQPENRPAIGSGRTDVSLGIGATKLLCDGKIGLNAALDYTMTGADNGNNPLDVFSAGFFADYGLTKSNMRVGTGLEYWCNTAGRNSSTDNDGASVTFGTHIPIKGYEYVIEVFASKGIMNDYATAVTIKFKHMF